MLRLCSDPPAPCSAGICLSTTFLPSIPIWSTSLHTKPNLFFFFSSRRRHTRSLCDWSSDVCSSDLILVDHPPDRRLPWFGVILNRPRTQAHHIVEARSVLDILCRDLIACIHVTGLDRKSVV